MNILILSWRDIKNPKSGGAEILTHEIAKRWVKLGHKVTLFTSKFNDGLDKETIDGVNIIRQGHPDARFLFSSVHFLAYKFYKKNFAKFDAVVDEIHGLPFFTPWYVKSKKFVLICEVAGSLWIKMFGPFFGTVGRLMEQFYLKYIYKGIPYLTISNSTKEELIEEGVDEKNITVLPMGITVPKEIKKFKKENSPTLIFVGRLSKSKGIEDAIKALDKVSQTYNNVKLWVVGGGEKPYVNYLKKMAKKFKVDNRVTFFGYVSQGKKFELMAKAHILLAPSVKEGFGLIVPEAARVGTPSIVYDVPGLRDIVKNGVNGIKVKKNTPDEIANAVVKILEDNNFYRKLQDNAIKLSLSYNWDNTAKVALNEILMEIR